MLACRKGHLNVVKLFMSNPNFDSLNYKNIDGQTAYVLAYQYGHNKIVEFIRTHQDFQEN
jgi:ankyrin repeat protein